MDLSLGEVARRIRAGTQFGIVDGALGVSPRVRTLDYLNMSAERFITLAAAETVSGAFAFGAGPVSINGGAVRWVVELGAVPRNSRPGAQVMNRSSVRFCLRDCEIRGYVHTPGGGDPTSRWNQGKPGFVAVTSASVEDADLELATPFVAVNRAMILAAEVIGEPAGYDEPDRSETDHVPAR